MKGREETELDHIRKWINKKQPLLCHCSFNMKALKVYQVEGRSKL